MNAIYSLCFPLLKCLAFFFVPSNICPINYLTKKTTFRPSLHSPCSCLFCLLFLRIQDLQPSERSPHLRLLVQYLSSLPHINFIFVQFTDVSSSSNTLFSTQLVYVNYLWEKGKHTKEISTLSIDNSVFSQHIYLDDVEVFSKDP